MKSENLQNFDLGQLIDAFREAAFGLADEEYHPRRYKKFYDRLKSVSDELRRRGHEARRALVPLLDCQGAGPSYLRRARGAECRYRAAWELLAVEPERARAALNALAQGWSAYQRALARGTLAHLEDGTLKPN